MLINPAFAQATGEAANNASLTGTIIQMLLIIAIFYFLLIRPQQKRIKEHEAELKAIKRGDKIITGGGVFAKVVEVIDDKDELKAEIAPNLVVSIARSTVREVVNDTVAPAEPAQKTKNKKQK